MKAMYTGSFDPFTLGHLDIVDRVLQRYEQLIICIGKNEAKSPFFTIEQRKKFIELAIADHPRAKDITVISSDELTVDTARQNNVNALVRGIRSEADIQNEKSMAETNRFLAAQRGLKLKTQFFTQENLFLQTISSSLVQNLLKMNELTAAARCLPQSIAQQIIADKLKPLFGRAFLAKDYTDESWNKIVKAYTPRPYHNLLHLAYMFDMLNIYLKQEDEDSPFPLLSEMHLAIFLHDYVYKTRQNQSCPYQNEKGSAKFAHKLICGQAYQHINDEIISELIMATTHDDSYQKEDFGFSCQLIADLDLSILGTEDVLTYEAYVVAIRKEYAAYSDEEYEKRRRSFLFSLLKKEHIFHTEFFRKMLEKQARKNIENEIKRLSHPFYPY